MIKYFNHRTDGDTKSEGDSKAEILEEFILNSEIEKMQRINALNDETVAVQQRCIAELESIDIPELHRVREVIDDGMDGIDGTAESADDVDAVQNRLESALDFDDEQTEDEEDGENENNQESELRNERTEPEQDGQSVQDQEKQNKMQIDDAVEDDDDDIMVEIERKYQRQNKEQRYLSDSELNHKDGGNMLIPPNRALSQRVYAIPMLPELSPMPMGLSQMSAIPRTMMTEKSTVNERRASSLQPNSVGDLVQLAVTQRAQSAVPPQRREQVIPDLC